MNIKCKNGGIFYLTESKIDNTNSKFINNEAELGGIVYVANTINTLYGFTKCTF